MLENIRLAFVGKTLDSPLWSRLRFAASVCSDRLSRVDLLTGRHNRTALSAELRFRFPMLDRVSFQKLQQSIRQLGSPNVRQSTGLAWIEGTRSFVRAVDQGHQ